MSFGLDRFRPWAGSMSTLALLALAAAGSACSKEEAPPQNNPVTEPENGEITGLVAVGQQLLSPVDGTPSPDGKEIYFLARKEDGSGAVFKVSAAGGAEVELAGGFASPVQIVASLDGSKLYVADLGADDGSEEELRGKIFTVEVSGGATTELQAARGYAARGLDLIRKDSSEVLYFSGNDPATGDAGVFRMAAGGSVEKVFAGAPLVDPSGLAVKSTGEIYVVDTTGSSARAGAVLELSGTSAREIAGGLRVGYPSGIALSKDESVLLVSALDATRNGSIVHRIELASGATRVISIANETESAGLHRAHAADTYAWSASDVPGTVYRVTTRAVP